MLRMVRVIVAVALLSPSYPTLCQAAKSVGTNAEPSENASAMDVTKGAPDPARDASSFGNPSIEGGLLYPGDSASLSSQMDVVTLLGERSKAQIARAINLQDGQTGPQSGPNNPTAETGSYGLSITGYRPNWVTSKMTGEMDGISVLLRQSSSDTAALLSNVGVRDGFAATIESMTFAADANGSPFKAIRAQLGVANPRDNSYVGLGLAAEAGQDLNAGLLIYSSTPSSSWLKYIHVTDPKSTDVFYIRGSDGTTFTRSIVPIAALATNVGAPQQEYDTFYGRFMKLLPVNYEAVSTAHPCSPANVGFVARIYDAAAPITSFNQIISAGGGNNSALITCDGDSWRAISS